MVQVPYNVKYRIGRSIKPTLQQINIFRDRYIDTELTRIDKQDRVARLVG